MRFALNHFDISVSQLHARFYRGVRKAAAGHYNVNLKKPTAVVSPVGAAAFRRLGGDFGKPAKNDA